MVIPCQMPPLTRRLQLESLRSLAGFANRTPRRVPQQVDVRVVGLSHADIGRFADEGFKGCALVKRRARVREMEIVRILDEFRAVAALDGAPPTAFGPTSRAPVQRRCRLTYSLINGFNRESSVAGAENQLPVSRTSDAGGHRDTPPEERLREDDTRLRARHARRKQNSSRSERSSKAVQTADGACSVAREDPVLF